MTTPKTISPFSKYEIILHGFCYTPLLKIWNVTVIFYSVTTFDLWFFPCFEKKVFKMSTFIINYQKANPNLYDNFEQAH